MSEPSDCSRAGSLHSAIFKGTFRDKALCEHNLWLGARVMRDLTLALWTLRACNFCHGDVKPANGVLLDDGMHFRAAIIDNGHAAEVHAITGQAFAQHGTGTPGYAPVEQQERGEMGEKGDVFGLVQVYVQLLRMEQPGLLDMRLLTCALRCCLCAHDVTPAHHTCVSYLHIAQTCCATQLVPVQRRAAEAYASAKACLLVAGRHAATSSFVCSKPHDQVFFSPAVPVKVKELVSESLAPRSGDRPTLQQLYHKFDELIWNLETADKRKAGLLTTCGLLTERVADVTSTIM